MDVTISYLGETRHYVKYESTNMDFSFSSVKIRAWIPKEEIQTNMPGVYPPNITVRIIDDNS